MKKTIFSLSILSLTLLSSTLFMSTPVEAKRFDDITTPDPTRVLVIYKENIQNPDGTQRSRFESIKLSAGETIESKVAQLKSDPNVRAAAPNYTRAMSEIVPNDVDSEQYSIDPDSTSNVDVVKAWSVHKGKGAVVAVIDTGVDLDHEDLKKKIWKNTDEIADNGIDDDGNGYIDDKKGFDFVNNNGNPNPDPCNSGNGGVSHGTHVAGIAAAKTDNSKGIAGMGWHTKIMALQVAGCDGSMSDAAIAEAVEYAVANGADVINLSLGGFGKSSVLEAVIEDAIAQGVVVVAAAGNEGINVDRFTYQPACITGVVTVAATDSSDEAASFSNFGSGCVDIAAPGVNVLSTVYFEEGSSEFGKKYDSYSGTSMATPVVAGIVSLLKAQEPSITPADVKTTLKDSAKDVGLSSQYGAGRVSAIDAMVELDSVKNVHIRAFKNSDKKKEYDRGSRRKDRTPYFKWTVPQVVNADIKEYCWYFGTNKDADPCTAGKRKEKPKKAIDKLDEANEKTYFLKISVIGNDNSVLKKGKFKYVLDTKIKPAPELESLTRVDSGVKLSWKKSSDGHVDTYQILRKASGDESFTKIDVVAGDVSSYTDTTATAGKTYTYKIKARDSQLKLKKASNTKDMSL